MHGGTWTATTPNEVDLVDEEEALLTGPSLDEHNKALVKDLGTATRLLTQARGAVLRENYIKFNKNMIETVFEPGEIVRFFNHLVHRVGGTDEIAIKPAARHDAKEASNARTALRKRWVGVVKRLGPGYRTARGEEMPDWVAVAHLPSYKIRRLMHKCSVEVPKTLMPNRQRTLRSFLSTVSERGLAAPAQLETPAAVSADTAPAPRADTGEPGGDAEVPEQSRDASAARRSEATATPPHARSHDIDAMPMPWGEKPKQGALRGVVTSFDLDGRCSYAATHKCRSAAWHWPLITRAWSCSGKALCVSPWWI